ncbi:Probable 3-hydroxyisobutyrate dehydrogenase, mitochondrial [Geodia barretti]|uniref:3-hydroxyisobutyrate dehydrogenase n=1 Tax=Geodia barretti TaxID=519541 RepID=A0AA35X0Y1_GEOBA|nr:Probable 3-hydroxyisobutyrate dehydrogenase, mitochondrial [Geodia barretti]
MNIGFIGLGNMGGGMAANVLRAGHDLTVHDLRREAATPLLESGAAWADTPAELAAACDIVLTSLPGPREVEAITLGEGSGSIAKLMHNCIGYGLQTIVAECLTLGVKAGVDPQPLFEAISNGSHWIHYDPSAVFNLLVEAKTAAAVMRQMPYLHQWIEQAHEEQLRLEAAGTSRIEGAEFTPREQEEALASESPQRTGLTHSQRQLNVR